MRLLIAFVVWIAAVLGAAEVSSVVAHSIHHSGSGGSGSSADPSTITSTDSGSLFHAADFNKALATARAHLGADARIDNLALYPGYLSLTAVKGSTETDFYVDANGRTETTTSGGGAGGDTLFSLSKVRPGTPALLARRIANQARTPQSQLHYMIAETDPISHRFQWLVYTVSGSRVEYFQAAGAGGRLFEYKTNSSTGLQPVSHSH